MKKTNRSQSSFRAIKTLQSQDQGEAQWLGNFNGKKMLKNANSKIITTSMIECNKENTSNNSLYQSISERDVEIHKKQNQFSSSRDQEDVTEELRKKCRTYERQLSQMYKMQKMGNFDSKSFNYSEQYYINEINDLKNQINEKEEELNKFRMLYSSKNTEIQDMSSQISIKIQKQQKDKNLLIKELNTNSIEINKLRDLVRVYNSQKQTLMIFLKEKEALISELEGKLSQVDVKKKKIEHYETQIRESHQLLKDIELQTQKLKEETQKKDEDIQYKSKIISKLEEAATENIERMLEFQRIIISLNEEKKTHSEKFEEMRKQTEKWRESYSDLIHKSEEMKELQISLKNSQSTIDELKKRNSDLLNLNEKLKSNQINHEKAINKCQQLEKDLATYRRQSKEKDQKIIQLESKERSLKEVDLTITKIKKEKEELALKLHQKMKQNKLMNNNIEDLRNKLSNLSEQTKELQENSLRAKDRNQKIDSILKENSKLTTTLVQKINEIQKLQHKINSIQSKLNNVSNQNMKNKAMYETKEQQVSELELQVQNIRQRYQTQLSHRLETDQKLLRSNQQIISFKNSINKFQDEKLEIIAKFQQKQKQNEENVKQFKSIVIKLEQSKNISQQLLIEAQKKIEWMKGEVLEMKRQIDAAADKQRQNKQKLMKMELKVVEFVEKIRKLQNMNEQLHSAALKIRQINEWMIQMNKHASMN